ncbi:unnamed protein product, partial [Ixodes persulcatus]
VVNLRQTTVGVTRAIPAKRVCHSNVAFTTPPFSCTEQEGTLPFAWALKTFPCGDCDSHFSSRHFLERHRTQRHAERRHRCSLCPFSSNKKDSVLRHERTHTGERPFACGTCGKAFTRHYDLAEHRRLHTGERLHECAECGMSFIKRGDLVRHARTHSGDKPFSCHLCEYRTSDSSNVRKHVIQVHTKEFPHTCERCGRGFVAPFELRAHLAEKHPYVDGE